jgi:hypothetical protein
MKEVFKLSRQLQHPCTKLYRQDETRVRVAAVVVRRVTVPDGGFAEL